MGCVSRLGRIRLSRRRFCNPLGRSLGCAAHCCAISVARARASLTAAFPRSIRSSARRTAVGTAKSCSLVIFMIRPPTARTPPNQITPPDRGLLMVVLVNCLTSCARRDHAADTSIIKAVPPSAFWRGTVRRRHPPKSRVAAPEWSRGPPPDYVFFFGRSARNSRNSPGPFRTRRFLCWCSSAVADGSASLSICWPARSMAFDVAFGHAGGGKFKGVDA